MGYSDTNRAFLQAFMARRLLSRAQAEEVLEQLGQEKGELPAFVSAANAKLHALDMEIRQCRDQLCGGTVFVLVNTVSDEWSQLATLHKAEEIALMKVLLEEMFEANNQGHAKESMAVSGVRALNLALGTGMKMQKVQETLDEFVEEGWLRRTDSDYYTLSTRGLMELQPYLLQTFNEPADDNEEADEIAPQIKLCFVCGDMVTLGQRCRNPSCFLRLHNHCATQLFAASQRPACPKCTSTWSASNKVGPE